MNRNTKRGFTIVELIIVIAVIAILAAVLIPTFSGLIKNAQVARDESLVSSLNKALAMDTEITTHKTMYQALQSTAKAGYDVTKIKTTADGNAILWDSVNDCFVYLDADKDTNKPQYIPDSIKTDREIKNYEYWTISETTQTSATYSTYLSGNGLTGAVTATTGIDVGENSGITAVNYNGTTSAQSVVVRTVSICTDVTISGYVNEHGSGDVISHYGKAGSVIVNKCANDSFHEYGKVGYVEIEEGHCVIEDSAKIRAIVVSGENVIVDENVSNSVILAYAKTESIKVNHKGNVKLDYIYTKETIETVKSIAKLCEEGIGTEENPFLIGQDTFANVNNLDELLIADVQLESSPIRYYKLTEDVDFSVIKHNFSNQQCYVTMDKADIDLNEKTIKNLDLPLVMYKNYLNVHDGQIQFVANGSIGINYIFGGAVEVIVKNVLCSGSINGSKGIIGPCFASSMKLNLENVKSYVEINSDQADVAGLIGCTSANFEISLKNCKVYGDITTSSNSASGMINGTVDTSKIFVENSFYYGTITVAKGGKGYYCAPGYANDSQCNGGARIEEAE